MQSSTATVRWRGVISEADPAGDWPHRLAGRAAWRRHCPSGEGARRGALQWRRFGNGLTAALDLHAVCAFTRPWLSRLRAPAASTGPLARGVDKREVRQLRYRVLPGAARTSGCRRGRAQPGGARPSAGQGSRAQRRVRPNFELPRAQRRVRWNFKRTNLTQALPAPTSKTHRAHPVQERARRNSRVLRTGQGCGAFGSSRSSTSNTSVAFGGIGPRPRSP